MKIQGRHYVGTAGKVVCGLQMVNMHTAVGAGKLHLAAKNTCTSRPNTLEWSNRGRNTLRHSAVAIWIQLKELNKTAAIKHARLLI